MDPQLLTVLMAFIAPVSAIVAGLGGVIIGQRMARNTAAQQINAQDRRNELARSREDRFRHVNSKRDLYANLASVTVRYIASLQSMKEVASRLGPEASYPQVKASLIEAGAELP